MHGDRSTTQRERLSLEDESYNQKTKYEGPHPTVQYDPAEEYSAYEIPCRIIIMILPLTYSLIYIYLNTLPLILLDSNKTTRNPRK